MLIDTCILIEYFRQNREVARFLAQNAGKMKISTVTDMDIAQGVRNKRELKQYEKLLEVLGIHIIEINESISTKARLWVRGYGLSHGLYVSDALIAATASLTNIPLVTFNQKNFKFLDINILRI